MYEYRVIVDTKNRQIQVLKLDGTPADSDDVYAIAHTLMEEHEHKPLFVYTAHHLTSPEGPRKIGITYYPDRRESQLAGHIYHKIPCGIHKARLLERGLHAWLSDYSLGHEWFALPSEIEEQIHQVTDQKALRRMLENELWKRFSAGKLDKREKAIMKAIERLEFF